MGDDLLMYPVLIFYRSPLVLPVGYITQDTRWTQVSVIIIHHMSPH